MQPLIPPVAPEIILRELRDIEKTATFRGLDLCLFTADQAPNTMREIARIREAEFRRACGGTGHELDTDQYDTTKPCYTQLIALDPQKGQIAAAIRLLHCGKALQQNNLTSIRTSTLFTFSPEFQTHTLPHCLELGRSVVNKDAARSTSGLFALWIALSQIMTATPELKYLFGVVSMYKNYTKQASDAILQFLELHHAAPQPRPVRALPHLRHQPTPLNIYTGTNYDADYTTLKHHLTSLGLPMLPMLASYLGTSRTMKYYDSALNTSFGHCIELGIKVTMSELTEKTKKRFAI